MQHLRGLYVATVHAADIDAHFNGFGQAAVDQES